jgi:hypothetical protein
VKERLDHLELDLIATALRVEHPSQQVHIQAHRVTRGVAEQHLVLDPADGEREAAAVL